MATSFETQFITAADRPALVACSTPAWLEAGQNALRALGYKINRVAAHGEFRSRFSQIRYQVLLLEDLFCARKIEENASLSALQTMLMAQRRHAAVFLLGGGFQTLDPMQAFRHSVHAVIGASEMPILKQLIEKVVAENDLFLHHYREVQSHLAGR